MRLRLFHLGLGLPGARTLRRHLLRASLGVLQPRLRLRFLLPCNLHRIARSLFRRVCIGHGRLVRVGRCHRGVKLLLADDVFLYQRLVAIQIGLRLHVVGLCLHHFCVRGLQLPLRLRNAGLRAADIRSRRTQVAACVDGGDRHVHVGCGGVGAGAGQYRLRIFYRDVVVPGVQLGNQIARLHHLVLFHVHIQHRPVDARTDLDQVAVHLRIVGIFAECRVPPDCDRAHYEKQDHDHDDSPAALLRLLDLCLCRRRLAWCWCLVRHVYFPPR